MPLFTSCSGHLPGRRAAFMSVALLAAFAAAPTRAASTQDACSPNFSDYKVSIFGSTSPTSAAPDPSSTVYPPNGYKVLSGGAIVQTLQGSAFLTGSYPDFDSDAPDVPIGWYGDSKHQGTGTRARLTTYVIAVYDPNNCWSVKAFQQSTVTPSAHPSVTVALGTGYVLTGGGARAIPATPGGNGSFLYSSIPWVSAGSAYNGWSAQSKDQSINDPANITAWAIGIKPAVAGVNMPTSNVNAGKPSASLNNPIALANGYNNVLPGVNCTLTGGGANDNWGAGWGNLLTAIYPLGTSGWEALGQSSGPESASVLTAYSVCLN